MGRFKILIEDIVVGYLTDEGEIISDNPFVKKFAESVKEIDTFEMAHGKGATAWFLKKVKRGDKGYVSAVVEELVEAGYGVARDTS